MSNDAEIEKKIVDKGLTAPRITPADIENLIIGKKFHVFPDSCMTVCCLTLKNGFNTTGFSACASPENFNQEIGEDIAFGNAKQQIWALAGYLLKQKLFETLHNAKEIVPQDRTETYAELAVRLFDNGQNTPVMSNDVFVSHKKVRNAAMTLGEYNLYRGWNLPDDEDGSSEGYLIQYLDGGKPNHPWHSNYISWTPKAQFDNGYTKE